MHHEQDMRRMGGLRKYLPVTWLTMCAVAGDSVVCRSGRLLFEE